MERSEVGRSCQLHTAERMEGTSLHNAYSQIGK